MIPTISTIPVDDTTLIGSGHNSSVYEVSHKGTDYALKQCSSLHQLRKEVAILHLFEKQHVNIPVPRVITYHEESFRILMTKLSGEPCETLSCEQWRAYAGAKRELSTIQYDSYGLLDASLTVQDEFNTTLAFWQEEMEKFFQGISEYDVVSGEEVVQLRTMWNAHNHVLLHDDEPHLIQGDATMSNFLFQGDELTGVVDFEHARSGTFLEDVFQCRKGFDTRLEYLELFAEYTSCSQCEVVAQVHFFIAQVRQLYLLPTVKNHRVDSTTYCKCILQSAQEVFR